MLILPPLSVYIHYPWCVKKCPYCDFNSHAAKPNTDYIQVLLKDLDKDLKYIQQRSIQSIFIGGGTPSLMTVDELSALFLGLKKRLKFAPDIEITLEANPGSFDTEKFQQFRQIGVNRLSIGVQSFVQKHLQSLGRVHTGFEAIAAIKQAKKVGFDNFNIDLMYGLCEQTSAECLADITQAIALNPSHISFYQLTIEPNTLFAKQPPKLPKESLIWQMAEQGSALLEQSGFAQYEVSAYAKIACKHNLNYWQFGDYIGIGAGAHGKITQPKIAKIIRTTKPKSPKDFINNPNGKSQQITATSFEFMLNALRLKQGFDLSLFTDRTAQSPQSIHPQLTKAQSLGLLNINNNHLKPTQRGFNFLNDLQAIFLS